MTSVPVPQQTLASGERIPAIGLGTLELKDPLFLVNAVVEEGYRHLDTATDYENEVVLGEALKECMARGIPRDELFITSKIYKAFLTAEGPSAWSGAFA